MGGKERGLELAMSKTSTPGLVHGSREWGAKATTHNEFVVRLSLSSYLLEPQLCSLGLLEAGPLP